MKRYQYSAIRQDLDKKMVFLTGPRQAGKTWLAKAIQNEFNNALYLNYDYLPDVEIINTQAWLPDVDLLIFDELHKMPGWKNYLKGVYDTKPKTMRVLVTGSARMEIFQQLGDSLAGRYFLHHLLPFSPSECAQLGQHIELTHFIQRSGFPEPFLTESAIDAERWRQQYINSLLSTDVFEFDKITNVKIMHTLVDLLRYRVGSRVSYQSLAEDLQVSPTTVKKYIDILEALYIVFRITPYSKNIARSLIKDPKVYFYDTGLVEGDEGVKFENMLAVCLLKHCYGKNDYQAELYQLHYLRTKEQKEVDFVLSRKNEVEMIIEAKRKNTDISNSLLYFKNKYNFIAKQVILHLERDFQKQGVSVLRAERFLQELYL